MGCYADNGNGECGILTEKHCDGCKFAKTHEQFNTDKLAAMQRVESIPGGKFAYINSKYYGDAFYKRMFEQIKRCEKAT